MKSAPGHRGQLALVVGLIVVLAGVGRAAPPVQFVFELPPVRRDPFARDVSVEVTAPSGHVLHLPAFYFGPETFAVRARASETGEYRMGPVTETVDGREVPLVAQPVGPDRWTVKELESLPPVSVDPASPGRLVLPHGRPFVPLGANFAWASEGGADRIVRALGEFSRQDLNWMRVWMVHWDGLNLDWPPVKNRAPPPPGRLDLRVAADWDRIVAAAEEKGIYLQIVLQYHGQYSTRVNPNWDSNPWNATAPGGFLQTPGEFFTSPAARRFTAQKYRYIVARWGYSPAILAWELFNEVHWTDPINLDHDEATVARWHAEMAAVLRRYDVARHLVTTSTENLQSTVYGPTDFYQPHLYAANILAGARVFSTPVEQLVRPVFYGEAGDDHMELTDEQKEAGVAIVPPVWASLMGTARYPVQPWLGERLADLGRLGELGAVVRFLKASGLGQQGELTPFSAVVSCDAHVPFVLAGGHHWQRWAEAEFAVPVDGREPLGLAAIPRAYVGKPESRAAGFPGRVTYQLDLPRAMELQARVVATGGKGAALRISIDGRPVLEKTWPAHPAASAEPDVLSFSVPAGPHVMLVENPGGPDWFELAGIDFPLEVPALAAIGQRNPDFLALWIWHRQGVFAVKPLAPVQGELQLADVPAGAWTVTWWDTLEGFPLPSTTVDHPGGRLKLSTPPVSRHAAVVLTRNPRQGL